LEEFVDPSVSKNKASAQVVVFALTIIWFAASSIGFAWFLTVQFTPPELRSATAGVLAWPFVVLVIALPASLLIGANIRHLLGLKKTIDDAPEKLSEAFHTAEKLRQNLEETGGKITNDINGALGEIEARMTAFEGRIQRIVSQVPGQAPQPQQLTPRERLGAHLETASERFYETLEAWNSDGRRKGSQLGVTRGGGNRSELVERLRASGAFDRDAERNNGIAAYLRAAFEKQLSARRGGVEVADVNALDELKRVAVAHGAALE
jgi:hypothetical protein